MLDLLFVFFMVAGRACKTSGLRSPVLKSAAHTDDYDRLVQFGLRERAPNLCFPLKGVHFTTQQGVGRKTAEFLPPPNTMMAQARDTSARVALRERWANLSKQCKGVIRNGPSKHWGWGGIIHTWLVNFTYADNTNATIAEPLDPLGTPWTHYGLMPTSDCETETQNTHGRHDARLISELKEPWHAVLWRHAQKMAWLLRPNVTLAKHLQRIKNILRWEAHRPILGLHVRLGDVCTQEGGGGNRSCDGLDTYMEKVEKMANLYGYKSIFLATDSADVVQNTSQYPQFTWIQSPTSGIAQQRDPDIYFDDLWSLPRVSRDFDDLLSADISRVSGEPEQLYQSGRHIPFTHGNHTAAIGKLNSYDFDADAHDFLLDTFLLADADGFVGKFSSNLDQIAYAVGLGQSGCATPHVSLDSIFQIREHMY